jgi:prophage antirepressor-like protein
MNNNNSLQKFTFSDVEVRVVQGEDGEPRFVAKDVVEGIGARRTGHCINRVPEEWKGLVSVITPRGMQQLQCLTEQGVYLYLARSNKPKALPFQKWLAGEVLPAVRKHGN